MGRRSRETRKVSSAPASLVSFPPLRHLVARLIILSLRLLSRPAPSSSTPSSTSSRTPAPSPAPSTTSNAVPRPSTKTAPPQARAPRVPLVAASNPRQLPEVVAPRSAPPMASSCETTFPRLNCRRSFEESLTFPLLLAFSQPNLLPPVPQQEETPELPPPSRLRLRRLQELGKSKFR